MTKQSSSKTAALEPQVGIFWLLGSRLFVQCIPLDRAEKYGNCLSNPVSHIDHWAVLQTNGEVPRDVEYEQPPRGRVVYDRSRDRFVLLADRCILKRDAVVQRIMRRMHLPADRTEEGTDAHYRCQKCLSGQRFDE